MDQRLPFLYSHFAFQAMGSHLHPHRNPIFVVGRHQEVRRFVSPGLHHITSVSSHCGMSRNGIFTSTWFNSFLPSPATILCHQQVFRTAAYWDRCPSAARKWRCWSMVELFVTLSVINQCSKRASLDIQLRTDRGLGAGMVGENWEPVLNILRTRSHLSLGLRKCT